MSSVLLYGVVLWSCYSLVAPKYMVQLPPSSSDFLRVGCYSNTNDSSSFKFVTVVRNETATNCLRACANVTLPLALYNKAACMCSHNDVIASSNQTTCPKTSSAANEVNTFQVFNITSLFAAYGEVMVEIHFRAPAFNITSRNLNTTTIIINFGDGNGNYTFKANSSITHRFLSEGNFKVSASLKEANKMSSLISRDVIIQQQISLVRMSCPEYSSTMAAVVCDVIGLQGSSIGVDLEVRTAGNVTARVKDVIPDRNRIMIGRFTPETLASNMTNNTQGTYIIPGLGFDSTTVIEAWEVLANRECLAKLQIFRPYKRYSCNQLCSWSSSCKQWTFTEGSNNKCNTPCLLTKQCIRNITDVCWLTKSSYYSIATFDVNLTIGYNFIQVPEHVRSTWAEYGDVIGWTSSDTTCIKTIGGSREQLQEVWFSTKESSSSSFLNEADTMRRNASFAVRVHGYSPLRIAWRFCRSKVETISVYSKFYNRLTSNKTISTITFEMPILGVSWHGITNFMVVNESRQFVIKAMHGTNLTCTLTIPGQQLVYSPFKATNTTTEGLTYRKNITFHKSETLHVSFSVHNLVSKEFKSFRIVVRLRVLGLVASMTYTDFVYQNALTYFNASTTQGGFVSYYWLFGNTPYNTKSSKATYVFRFFGKYNVTLYAHNSATYQQYRILTKVIHNPLHLSVPVYLEAAVAQGIGCALVWPGGTPHEFFKQQNLLGQKGADVPQIADLVMDFGDGQSVVGNSSNLSAEHTFTKNFNPGYIVQCTVKNRPEMNVRKTVLVLDRISGLQIKTGCPSSITVNKKCTFQTLISKGDKVDYSWTVKDGSVYLFYFSGSIEHKFIDGNPAIVKVNVSNPISWMEANITLTVLRPSHTSVIMASQTASTYTTTTTRTTPTTSIHSSTLSLSSSTYTNMGNSPSPSLSHSLASDPTVSKSLTFSPSPVTSVFPTSSPSLPSIQNASLVCPRQGVVGETLLFKVSTKSVKSLKYVWYLDEKSFSTTERSLNHKFTKQGIHKVQCKLVGDHQEVVVNCFVPIQYRIDGSRLTKLEVFKDLFIGLDFEVLQGTNVTYRVGYGDGGTSVGFLSKFPSQVKLTHKYQQSKTYTVTVSVSSLVGPNSTTTRTITVSSDTKCTIDDVIIHGVSRDKKSAPVILPQFEYSVSSSLSARCESTLVYNWSISHVLNETSSVELATPNNVFLKDRELVLPENTLLVGLYKLSLTVTSVPPSTSKTAYGYLRVREPSLVAVIDCGHVRTVSSGNDTILDASRSYDPANPKAGSLQLTFRWSCQGKDDAWFGIVIRNGSVLHFPGKRLHSEEYVFVVEVTSNGRRTASASQTIMVVSFDVPDLCIRCVENCGPKVLLFKNVVLSAKGWLKNSSITYTWRLYPSRGHHVRKRSTAKSSSTYVISQSELMPNRTYTVVLETEVNKTVLSAEYLLHTDNLPLGGQCDISPSKGKVIETSFQITCSGWEDQDSPLWYEYYYHDSNGRLLLMSYGWTPRSPPLYLPPGALDNNYTLKLEVNIVDTLGSRRRVFLNAMVVGFDASDGPVSEVLNGYVKGPSSKLGQILRSGEQQQAYQLMTTISTVLNEDGTSSGHTEREKVRLVLTKEFSRGCCSSLPSLRQVLGGLQGATRVPNEVTPESQMNGANGYQQMAQTLATKYERKSIESESKGIVDGLSDILEASDLSSSNAKENEKKLVDWLDDSNSKGNKEVLKKSSVAAQTCINGADQVARALLRRKKLGDNPSTIRTSRLELAVHRQPSSSIPSMKLDNTNTKFVIPNEGLGDRISRFGFIDTKVLTVRQSPFLSESETPISSQISSLELQDPNGSVIAINNLSNPIAIFLKNNNKEHTIDGVNTGCMEISVYKVEIKEPNTSLHLKANCSSNCSIVWRKDQHPSLQEYNEGWNVTHSNRTLKTILEWERLNGTGVYYLGISRKNVNSTSCDILDTLVYNISINLVSCMYWDDVDQRWSTYGCQVGPETTRHQIHCLCTHLTWFGGKFFVPPNKLDLDEIAARISDPSYYLPVLSVLCTIWAVYVLAVVWARREDKKDVQKVGVCISPSNKPDHNYIYEVTLTIGIRRGAGTTANTALMMYGEKNDSTPYLLTDIETQKTLQRGVTHTFLLTTKESLGQLLHVRVWHDNKGKDPALFVKQLTIRDIQTRTVFHFLCNRWFAVDEGDGMIDRVVPVTSDKEMTQFTQMFLSKTQRDLTDSHLWFSVVWRPPHSLFTRLQRASCCLSLLLCTMMANAMWYEADKGRYTKVDLGPLQFSWEQVSIGIMSSLIVFPINLLLVQLFRHSKLRGSKNKILPLSFHNNNDNKYNRLRASSVQLDLSSEGRSLKHKKVFVALQATATFLTPHIFQDVIRNTEKNNLINMDGSQSETTKQKKPAFRGLPHWCRYIGWVGVIATSLASSVVTLMYGIQFGKQTSEKWLLSMFISVTQDIFISQPVKVIALAIAFAFIVKKPQTNDKTSNEDEREKKKWLKKYNMSMSSCTIEAPTITRPTEDTLQMARKRKQQEKQMAFILKDIVSYLSFMLIILLIAYGQRDKSSFLQKESIEGLLLRRNYSGLPKGYLPDQFQKANKVDDMWKWLDNLVLPVLYNIPWYYYTGRPTPFVQGISGVMVGVARVRQLRISKGDCVIADEMRPVISQCESPYSTDLEDQGNYEQRWTPSNSSSDKSTLWQYNTAIQLTGFPYMGNVNTYSGGGYVLNLSPIYYKALKQISETKADLWTDGYSRAIFVEFNLYNPSSNLFTACTILIEVLPTGGFVTRNEFLTYRLYRYVGDFQLFIVAVEVLFLAFIVYFTYREGKSLYKMRWKYFKNTWNLIEFTIIILAWTSVAHYFIAFGVRKWTLQKYLKHPNDFTNFHYLSAWQVVFENIMALTVFTAFIKIIKLLNFNKRMYLLAHTIRHAARDIINYCFIFLVAFLAFSQLYYFMLGNEYQSFSTLIRSMERLLSVLLGKFNFDEFMDPFRSLGAMSFILYMFTMKFFLLNILVVLIIASLQEVKHSNKKLENEFEIIDFIVEQFKSFTGIRTLRKSNESSDDLEASETTILQDIPIGTKCVNENREIEVLLLRISELDSQLRHQYDSETFDEVLNRYAQVYKKNKLGKPKYLGARNMK